MNWRMVLFLFCILGLSGCKTVDLGIGQATPEVKGPLIQQLSSGTESSPQGEPCIVVSEKALIRQRTGLGVARNEVIEEYLNSILRSLQQVWPGENEPCHVFLIPSPEFSAYYADGGIFIAHGMLSEMESEDEVAACLAHEYSHALLGHDTIASGSELASRLYGIAEIYLQVKFGQGGNTDAVLGQFLINRAISEASQGALLPAFSREQEDEADLLGTDLLIKAGYNPIAMTYLLQRVGDWEARNQKRAEENELQLADMLKASSTAQDSTVSTEVNFSLDTMVNTISKDLEKAYAKIQRQHYPAAEREGKVKDYIREYYADVPRDTLKEKPFNAMLHNPKVVRFMTGLERLDASEHALYAKDMKKAKRDISAAHKVLYRGVAYARHVSVEVASLSKSDSADQLDALCKKPDSLLSDHEFLIASYEKESPEKALQVARDAYSAFQEPSRMLPTLIRLHKKLDNDLQATIYYGLCALEGDPQMTSLCSDAFK